MGELQKMKEHLRAITLWNPYAEAMRLGLKTNETRGRQTHVRGDVVICSAKRALDQDGLAVARNAGINLNAMKFGFALCVVELWACYQVAGDFIETVKPDGETMTKVEWSLGNYEIGRWVWRTRNLRPLAEPVAVKGGQGFFFITGEARRKIEAQL